MALDDFLDPEVAVAAGVSAAIFSPTVRGLLRRGAVYTVAGALLVGDVLAATVRGAASSAQEVAGAAADVVQDAVEGDGKTAAGGRGRSRSTRVPVESAEGQPGPDQPMPQEGMSNG